MPDPSSASSDHSGTPFQVLALAVNPEGIPTAETLQSEKPLTDAKSVAEHIDRKFLRPTQDPKGQSDRFGSRWSLTGQWPSSPSNLLIVRQGAVTAGQNNTQPLLPANLISYVQGSRIERGENFLRLTSFVSDDGLIVNDAPPEDLWDQIRYFTSKNRADRKALRISLHSTSDDKGILSVLAMYPSVTKISSDILSRTFGVQEEIRTRLAVASNWSRSELLERINDLAPRPTSTVSTDGVTVDRGVLTQEQYTSMIQLAMPLLLGQASSNTSGNI